MKAAWFALVSLLALGIVICLFVGGGAGYSSKGREAAAEGTLESHHCVFSWSYQDAPQIIYLPEGNEEVPVTLPGTTHMVYQCDHGEEIY